MTAGKDIFLPRQLTEALRRPAAALRSLGVSLQPLHSARIIIDIPAPDCHNKYRNGDIAQLGERCLRKAEAEGSNPFISTMTLTRAETLRVFYTTICLGRYDGRRETLG